MLGFLSAAIGLSAGATTFAGIVRVAAVLGAVFFATRLVTAIGQQ